MATRRLATEHEHLWDLSPAWNVLTATERNLVDLHISIHQFKKNQLIHYEGDEPTHMMVLVKGKVKVYKEGVGNRNQIMRMLKPYEHFGYRAIIAGEQYNTNVCAFEPSTVYMLPKDIFLSLLKSNRDFCYHFLVELATDLGAADKRSVNLTQKHIRGRLAEALLSLKNSYGVEADGATISMYMSREDLANLSNMTASNAIRTLSNFASEEVISIDGRKIKILDNDRLMKISRMG